MKIFKVYFLCATSTENRIKKLKKFDCGRFRVRRIYMTKITKSVFDKMPTEEKYTLILSRTAIKA